MKSGKKKPAQFCFHATKLTALVMALLVSLSVFSVSAFAADVAEQIEEQPVMAEAPAAEAPAAEAPVAEAPVAEASKAETPATEAPVAEAPAEGGEAPVTPTEGGETPTAPAEGAASAEGGETPAVPAEGEKISTASAEGEETPATHAEGEETPAAPTEGEETPAAPAEGGETSAAPAEGEETPAAPAEGVETSTSTAVPMGAASTVQEAPAGAAVAANPAMLAYAPLGEMPNGDKIETIVEVEMTTANEKVNAATANLKLHDETDSNPLQDAINSAIRAASGDVATVTLDSSIRYEGSIAGLYDSESEETVGTFVFQCNNGQATINSDLDIASNAFIKLINVLFGNDCTLVVSGGQLTLGEKNGQTFTGNAQVIVGDPENPSVPAGKVVVNAGDRASVTSNIIKGTMTVTNSAGDSIVFSSNTNVGITSGEGYDTAKNCNIIISAPNNVILDYINAWDANVVVNAPVATVAKRSDGNINQLKSFKVIAGSENSEAFNLTDALGLSDILAKIGVTDVFSVAAPVEKAQVKINAGIKAREDITVYSFTTQTKGLLNTFVNLAMNVKIGSATIELADGVQLEAGRDITLKATTRSSAGYNEESGKAEGGVLPLAFNVFVEEASVDLGKGTSFSAGRDIIADALSTVEANATCSFALLPFGAAFNVILNDASVKAVETSLNAGNDVNLISKASTKAVADALRSPTNDSLDGVYIATNVVLQSSETMVGTTTITAGADVNISSTSDVDATDDAIASPGKRNEEVSALPVKGILKSIGYKLLGNIKDKIFNKAGEIFGEKANSLSNFFSRKSTLIGKAQKYFETDGYAVEIDASSQEKGTVTASTASTDSKLLTISVDSKYNVEKVLVRYLPSDTSSDSIPSYKFAAATLQDGKYTWSLPETVTMNQFRVYVFYSSELKSEVELEDMPSKNDDDDDIGSSIYDLFNNAVESAADDSDADADCAGTIVLDYQNGSNGIVVTDAMSASVSSSSTSISALTGVAAGKNVRFNPNPALGYKVKSMAAEYTTTGGEKKTVAIEKNNAGHYVFSVPTDIKDYSLTIKTEFELGEEPKSSPSDTQVTGSLAVGVVVNHNDAVVDLGTGSITAAGKVNLTAEATSNIAGKADGTAVTKGSIDKASSSYQAATGDNVELKQVDIMNGGKKNGEKLYVYGKSTENGVTATVEGTVYTVKLSPDTDFGFKMPDSITLYVLGEDNREHAINVSGSNGTYTVDTAKIGYTIRSKKLIAKYGVNTYKLFTAKPENGSFSVDRVSVTGKDTITILSVTPAAGYTVDKMVLNYLVVSDDSTDADPKYSVKSLSFESKNGKTICTLPEDSELAKWVANSMTVAVSFKKLGEDAKHTVSFDGSLGGNIVADKTSAYSGEKVSLKYNQQSQDSDQTYKINPDKLKVSYTTSAGKIVTIAVNPDLTFMVPVADAIPSGAAITVNAEEGYLIKVETKIVLAVSESIENGNVSIANGKKKTGSGDEFIVNVKGNDGYVLDTLTAEYTGNGVTKNLGAGTKVSDGVYKFTVSDLTHVSDDKITVTAKFKETATASFGVAVAVNVGVHRNNALIRSGSVNAAKGIMVNATTNGKGVTESLAGYSSGKTGIAGAIAVEVISYKTNAAIGKGVYLSSSGSDEHQLSVNAAANISSFKTSADASNSKKIPGVIPTKDSSGIKPGDFPGISANALPGVTSKDKKDPANPYITPEDNPSVSSADVTGVGTGIAVAVNGVETKASVSDGVVYNYVNRLEKASVSAGNTLASDEVNAKAGAKSKKTAVTPVVALNIVSSNAKAYIGKFKDSKALNALAVEVKASNKAGHAMTVEAFATGEYATMAGSFGISIIDDTAKAVLNSNVMGSASDVTVDAQSDSKLTANVKASAAGAKEGKKEKDDSKGSADQKADNLISSGEKIGAKAGMGSSTEGKIKNRQQAQTSEGTIAGAAAFALNIQSNESEARIEDGVKLGGSSAGEKLRDVTVSSSAMASSDITGSASATAINKAAGKAVGIGVAVAINIVSTGNNAYLGTGNLNAEDVAVTALMGVEKVGDDEKERTSTFKTASVSGASSGGVGVAGSVALAVLNNTTSARINKLKNDMYSAASTTLTARDNRTAETTASASATKDGKPDKNDTKGDKNKTADADAAKSVGVGASFAMVYGNNSVIAEFVAPSTVNNSGDFVIEALSDHSEESTAVSGKDPYQALFDPASFKYEGKATNIAVDAAVAVNAIQSVITAEIKAAGDGYTPSVNTKSVRINAHEKGHSKTDASGYAMGDETAVGGSVAVNLNRATVRASNGSFLVVSGGDYTGDDEEDHQRSVEITASSAVTEENLSYATAAGSDVLYLIQKYKSILNLEELSTIVTNVEKLAENAKKFFDGTYLQAAKEEVTSVLDSYKSLYTQFRDQIKETGRATKEILDSLRDAEKKAEDPSANSGNSLADILLGYVELANGVSSALSKTFSLGSNLLRAFNIGTPATKGNDKSLDKTTEKATGAANEGINGSSQTTSLDNNAAVGKDAESMQIAAAVGVSISSHTVLVENKGGIQTEGAVRLSADNTVDAKANAVGAAVSTNKGTGSIALAIAVKVDNNITKAVSQGSITAGSGKDVAIAAELKENTNDFSANETGCKTNFTRDIGTEAIAGAVAGKAKVAISGALAVFVSSSETLAELADNAAIKAVNNGRAGDVNITATETARQTLRTIAASASQAKLTLGISAGVLVTENKTIAKVGKNASVKAANINVNAERISVAADDDSGIAVETTEAVPDFGNAEGSSETDKKGTTEVSVIGLPNAKDPVIAINSKKVADKESGSDKTVLSVKLDRDKTVELLKNVLDQFAAVDYYIAVDSGAAAVGSATSASSGVGSVAGSVAVVTIHNEVSAIVGEGALLDSTGDVAVEATSAEQSRIVSGAVSASPSGSKVSTGAVIAFLYEENVINALINDGALLTAGGELTVIGKNAGRSEVYTVTAAASSGSTATVAATIDVILSEASVNVKLGNPGTGRVHTAQSAKVLAENSKALRNITVSLAGTTGQSTVQAGGAVAVILENSSATVTAEGTRFSVNGLPRDEGIKDSIIIRADNSHDMFIIVASASVAVAGGSKVNVAGVVSIILDESDAIVSAAGSEIKSNSTREEFYAGNIIIAASNASDLLNVNVQATVGGSTAAIGAAVTVNILKRQVINTVSTAEKPTVIELYNGNASLTADAADKVIIVAAGANGSAANASVQGSIVVLVENNRASVIAQKVNLAVRKSPNADGCGDAAIHAKFTGELYGVAGGINFTLGSTAAGATVVVAVTNNTTMVDLTDSTITSDKTAEVISSADTKSLFISIGAAVANSTAVEGSVVTVVSSDTIEIRLGKTSIESGMVSMLALGKSSETYISGAIAGSGNVAVGPSVLVFVKERTVSINSTPGGKIGGVNGCNVTALAQTEDDIFTLVLAAAASGSVSVSAGVCTEIIDNTVLCDIDADVNAGRYIIDIAARSDRNIANYIFGGGFGSTAAVVPVATVIYLTDEITCDVSGSLKGYSVNIKADTFFNLKEFAAGAALSSTAGISGTFAVVVNNSDTKAIFTGAHTGKARDDDKDDTKLNVLAKDHYKFNSLMANLAGSGTAAVGVTAAITVVKNSVLASVGDESEKKNIYADQINVSANSTREISNIIGSLAAAGTAAVSVNVAVIVAGSKLPQDAYDMLTRTDDNGNASFSSDSILNAAGKNAYAANQGYLDNVTLGEDIQGNGKKDSDTQGTSVDGSTFVEGLASEKTQDYTASEDNAKEADILRGESTTVDPSTDASVGANAQAAKEVVYTYEGISDIPAVQAIVKNVAVYCKELSITADDIQIGNIYSVNVAASAEAAAAVGVSVLVLHSNVMAELASTAEVTCRNLAIKASSGSGTDEVKVIGGVVGIGVGTTGVAVAVAVVHLDDFVKASLAGKVTAALNDGSGINSTVNVIAESNYKKVLAETVAIGAGAVGVSASVAVVNLNGEVISSISGQILSARNNGTVVNGFYSVNDLVFFNNSITARAACLAGGIVGAAAGVAVASETLRVKSAIEEGAVVELDCTNTLLRPVLRVLVAGSYDEILNQTTQGVAQSLAQIAAISGGDVAADFAVAVAYVEPMIRAYIAGTVKNDLGGLDATVGNDIYTKADTGLFSAAIGGAAFGANVLISYNKSNASSTVTGSVTADALTVMSLLSANAVSNMLGIQAGGVAIGVSTAIAILDAENTASVENGDKTNIKANMLNVLAGAAAPGTYQSGANFFADAQLYSGSVSEYEVQLNVAIAVNKAINKASLNTNGNVLADAVNVYAYGNPTASSKTNKYSAELAGVGGSAAASSLNFRQIVEITCDGLQGHNGSRSSVNGGSYMYPGEAKDPEGKQFTRDYNQAYSSVDIFNISGFSFNGNVSYAKNKTLSQVIADIGSKVGNVSLVNNGSANSFANIAEVGGNVVGANANVALSYVQAQFITRLNMRNDVEGNVDLATDYTSNADASAKAASGSLVGLNANVIVGKSTTMADTYFNGNSHSVKADSVSVRTLGDSATQAKVLKPAKVSVSAVTIAANVIESILSTKQAARIENVNFAGKPTVLVNSVLNAGSNSKENSSLAKFEGAPDADNVNLGDLKVNVVLAKNYAENLASLSEVTSPGTKDDMITRSTVSAENASNACADAGSSRDSNDGFDVSLVSIGVVVTTAHNEGKNTALVENYRVATETLNVTADMRDASAESYGGTSSQGVGAALTDIKVNVSDAVNKAENTAKIANSQAAIKNVALKATAENVHAKAHIGTAKLTVSGINVTVNNVTATNSYQGNALVECSSLTGEVLDVQSLENQHFFEDTKYNTVTSADVGSAGAADENTKINLVGGDVNNASAENVSEVNAKINGSFLNNYAVSVFADGRSDVKSDIAASNKFGLLNVAALSTEAKANGKVLAEFAQIAGQESSIKSLDVKALGQATAEAVTGAAGSISMASAEVNNANADIQMQVNAVVSGGKLNVADNASVNSIASAVANAKAQTPGFTMSAMRIGINNATATSKIQVRTDILPDEYNICGSLNAAARIPTEEELKYVIDNHRVLFNKSSTDAVVAPSAGGKDESVSVTLVGGYDHTAEATSEHKVTVNIGGDGTDSSAVSGTITAGSLNAEAVGNANTDAKALDVDASYGLMTAGGKVAHAVEKDVAAVNIKTVSIHTNGAVDIKAHNDSADAHAVGTTPGGFSAGDFAKSEMQATVDNSAKITVSDNAIIEGGSISFKAANSGNAETSLAANGSKSSLASVKNASASVDETYNTEILFGNGSKVLANEKLNLLTDTYSKSYSYVNQKTGAAAFDAAKLHGSSTVTSTNHIQTGSNAAVSSKNSDVNVGMTNRGDIRSGTDYNSSFSLIDTNAIRSYNNYTAENKFEMLDNSSVAAENGNVVINQNSSGVTLDSSASSTSRSVGTKGEAGGVNTVNSSNTVQFADISAKDGIAITQYGGAQKATALGTVYESAVGGDCKANGINDFTINNLVNALDSGDLKAEGIMIVQGTDRLDLKSGAKGVATGAIFHIDGSSNNNVKINNNLANGENKEKIGQGAKRIYVSDIDAKNGHVDSTMEASSTFVKFGSISSTNNLSVNSTFGERYNIVQEKKNEVIDPSQGGFHVYQNELNPNKITGATITSISYNPKELKRYDLHPDPVNPSNNNSNTNYQKQTSSNSFVDMFLQMLLDSQNTVRGLGDGLKFYLDEDGNLVIENSAFFAADLEQMDANWLYNFLTAGNIRFMGNFHSISELDLSTTLSAIINSSIPAYEVDENYVSIVFSVDNNGENHVFKIVFDRASGKVSAYCVDDGKMIPVSIVIIEMNGVLNVIAYHEDDDIREAFIYIPDLVDGKLPLITVRVNASMLFKLFQK